MKGTEKIISQEKSYGCTSRSNVKNLSSSGSISVMQRYSQVLRDRQGPELEYTGNMAIRKKHSYPEVMTDG